MRSVFSGILLLLTSALLHAQSTELKWSALRFSLTEAQLKLMVETEHMMYDSALSTNRIMIFEGFHGQHGYNVRMSKMAATSWLHDSVTSRTNYIPVAELISLWNTQADSFSILGFQPMLHAEREHRRLHLKWIDTSCHAHIPFAYYRSFVDEWKMKQLNDICLQSLAQWMSGSLVGDTIQRWVRFYGNSKTYLPQADFFHLARMFEDGMLIGKLSVFSSDNLTTRLSKYQVERLAVTDDSTFMVEDPKNPHHYILIPIRRQAQKAGVIISEKWIPDTGYFSNVWKYYYMPVYKSYRRVVSAYGLCYDNGRIAWFDPRQVEGYFIPPAFNWMPYEESFRAERYETMHIETVR